MPDDDSYLRYYSCRHCGTAITEGGDKKLFGTPYCCGQAMALDREF